MENIIEIRNLKKGFNDLVIFDEYDLDIRRNSFTVISGASGSGKSTLLNMIGLLDREDGGTIVRFGKKVVKPFTKDSENLLREKIGYLFQNFALIDNKSVRYNLEIALENVKSDHKGELISKALKEVGLEGFEEKMIYKCSGGEQQRIALARLMLKPCELILADEPTGSLDHENKMKVVDLLKGFQRAGKTVVLVTHDEDLMHLGEPLIRIDQVP
jgi:putative ABC transport system ATP-binding protein